MCATTSQFLRKIKHFPKTTIPRDKSEVGVECREALIDMVKRRLHQIKLRLELLCFLHGVRVSPKNRFDHSSEKRMAIRVHSR